MFIEWSRNSDPKTTPDLVAPSPELNAANQILSVAEIFTSSHWNVFRCYSSSPSISFSNQWGQMPKPRHGQSSSKDLPIHW
ncbi:hypothetical protein AVEN_257792-1 [Araneus ventricosus]|uniref:Uncharacterized protein n=1 Tax=Araneus ventricosus TaxID=182803 RepID=A0A4Y2KDN9_ARAVE|nr:hypothetical protein AVEN_257792-1 [Araneus ventricosus]